MKQSIRKIAGTFGCIAILLIVFAIGLTGLYVGVGYLLTHMTDEVVQAIFALACFGIGICYTAFGFNLLEVMLERDNKEESVK